MPNNENNNFNNMNNEMPTPAPVTPQQPIIEIPQTYYEKLEKEKAEEEAARLAALPPEPIKDENGLTAKVIPLIIINAIVIFAIFYLTVNKNVLISAGTLIYIVLGSIIFAIKDKKKTEFPVSIIIGGMVSAVLCFVISMLKEVYRTLK